MEIQSRHGVLERWASRESLVQRLTPRLAFVACIEEGPLEAQCLLFFESIRRYGGPFRDCAIYAVSPRRGRAISAAARRELARQGVLHIEAPLNEELPHFPFANKPIAAAFVEETATADVIVVLDSDTVFLAPPLELLQFWKTRNVDFLARPVDLRGISTTEPGDDFHAYWTQLGEVCGLPLTALPFIETSIDRQRIRACYQSGFVAVRRSMGILRRWRDFQLLSARRGLRTFEPSRSIGSGTGVLAPDAAVLWGSDQACLAFAVWSLTERVKLFGASYNFPLHLAEATVPSRLVHTHYHWMFEQDRWPANPLRTSPAVDREARDWLESRLPLTRNLPLRRRSVRGAAPRRVLLAWWGSFPHSGTFGDLLAVKATVELLREACIPFDLSSAAARQDLPAPVVNWEDVAPADYDTLVYVCGPIVRSSAPFQALVRRFGHCRKIAAGVSVLPASLTDHWQPFDEVVARDGLPNSLFDLALAAPDLQNLAGCSRTSGKRPRIGVCLRGIQLEFGVENCQHERVRELIDAVLDATQGEPVELDTHIENSGLLLDEFLARFATVDVVLTSRLHGSLIALHLGIPFIAIDQIAGGAKLSDVLGRLGWSAWRKIDDVEPEDIVALSKAALAGLLNAELRETRVRAEAAAFETLEELRSALLVGDARPRTRRAAMHRVETLSLGRGAFLPERLMWARILGGELAVSLKGAQRAGVYGRLMTIAREAVSAKLPPQIAERVLRAGFGQIHQYVSGEELIAVVEHIRLALEPLTPNMGQSLARHLLGWRVPLYVEREPNVRLHVPFDSEIRAFGNGALKAYRGQRGDGKVTPHGAHRDPWLNCPGNGINLWIALGDVRPGNGLVLYPDVLRSEAPVDSRGTVVGGSKLGTPLVPRLEPGDVLLFRGDHLHASELNVTDETRFVVSFRITLGRPKMIRSHIHHYVHSGLRRLGLGSSAEWPAKLSMSSLREHLRRRLGTSSRLYRVLAGVLPKPVDQYRSRRLVPPSWKRPTSKENTSNFRSRACLKIQWCLSMIACAFYGVPAARCAPLRGAARTRAPIWPMDVSLAERSSAPSTMFTSHCPAGNPPASSRR